LSPSSRKAGCPAAISRSSTAAAIVDLPAPGRPVNHTVAPVWPSALQRCGRVTRVPCQRTLGLRSLFFCAAPPSISTSVSRITPAATVSLVAASITIRLPVTRLRR
jgi:hypothetical protein